MPNQENSTLTNRAVLLSRVVLNDNQASIFNHNFVKLEGDWNAVSKALTEDQAFANENIPKLEFTNKVADITGENEQLMMYFHLNNETNSLRDIGFLYDKQTLAETIKSQRIDLNDIEGDDEEAKIGNFSKQVLQKVYLKAPTGIIHRMLKTDEIKLDSNLQQGVVRFFDNDTDFDLRTHSIYNKITQAKDLTYVAPEQQVGVFTQLKNLQRVLAFSPQAELVPKLMEAGLTSAYTIQGIPFKTFQAQYATYLGSMENAQKVYNQAQNIATSNQIAYMNMRDVLLSPTIAAIHGNKDIEQRKEMVIKMAKGTNENLEETSTPEMGDMRTMAMMRAASPNPTPKIPLNYEALFGNVDLCECDHCNSVYSPAAYLVELFQYLRNNNLDNTLNDDGTLKYPNTGQKGIAGTPLEKLFFRRPDLGHLKLTCENTNKVLPYIDLVNEVMESFVVNKQSTDFMHPYITPHDVEDETTAELLSEAQHTNYQAYCILKEAVYPFSLPYHQAIDAQRLYLKYLDTNRAELLETFQPIIVTNNDLDKEIAQLEAKAYERAASAEFLGLTEEEYVILTKQDFRTKLWFEKVCKKNFTDAEYALKIGHRSLQEYYGFQAIDTFSLMQADLKIVKPDLKNNKHNGKLGFLKRTGLLYTDLLDLLQTHYINPNYPSGEALVVLNKIRYSYRTLQSLEDISAGTDYKKRYTPIVKLLKKQLEEEDDCNCDIERWVCKYFERIGKIIVLEAKTECKCVEGIIKKGIIPTGVFTHQPIPLDLYIDKNCELFIAKDNQKTDTKIGYTEKGNGKITITNNSYLLKDGATFSSIDGKIIGKIENDVLSLYSDAHFSNKVSICVPSQTDSCDITKLRIQHLDGSDLSEDEYDRIHRFIRLWRKFGWTMDELDKAIMGMGISQAHTTTTSGTPLPNPWLDDDCGCEEDDAEAPCQPLPLAKPKGEINAEFLEQLAIIKKLLDKTGIELIKLLTLWTPVSTYGKKSLYARLFLKHNITAIDSIFKEDKNGNLFAKKEKITEHTPALMAALNLNNEQIITILDYTKIPDELTLENVSVLYRYHLLAKTLSIRIENFVKVIDLLSAEVKPFASAKATWRFMEVVELIDEAGFKPAQLSYIILGKDEPRKPLQPNKITVLSTAVVIRDSMLKIEAEHPDIKDDSEASEAFLRAKLGLYYPQEATEKILAFLNGTMVYSDNSRRQLTKNLPTAEKDRIQAFLKAKIKAIEEEKPEGNDYKVFVKRVKFDTNGLQFIGILSPDDTTRLKTLSTDTDYTRAVNKMLKQSEQFFEDKLSFVFTDPNLAKAELLKSDLINSENFNLNTDTIKLAYFTKAFLPFLREELRQQRVIQILANPLKVDLDICKLLIMSLLQNSTAKTVYQNCLPLQEATDTSSTNTWKGFLIANQDENYQFYLESDGTIASLKIEGKEYLAERTINSPDDEGVHYFETPPIALKAGYAYHLELQGQDLIKDGKIQYFTWKTEKQFPIPVPNSALFPALNFDIFEQDLIKAHKAALFINGFGLKVEEVAYFADKKTDFAEIDYNVLTLKHWLAIEKYQRFKSQLNTTSLTLLDFFQWTYSEALNSVKPEDKYKMLVDKMEELTFWKKEKIEQLTADKHFSLTKPEQFRNTDNFIKLTKALAVVEKIGVAIDLLFDWAKLSKVCDCEATTKKCDCTYHRKIAKSMRDTIRACYTQEEWEQAIKPTHDELRNHQKDALIAYLLVQKPLLDWEAQDADGLFEFFLIDVQMDACMETSRIKQAISSVQTFIQRCLLGLEEGTKKSNIGVGVLDRKRWEWMQRYRVWEANRKVFLYPENWILTNLRDDKSPFYKELESELLQKDITKENVQNTLINYLYKVDEVANLEVVGLYLEGTLENGKLHIFGRTRNAPYFFFYRYYNTFEKNWYPWEKMQVDIPSYDVEADGKITDNGCYLTPVVWNNRLLIFFPQFMKKTQVKVTETTEVKTEPVDTSDPKKGTKTTVPPPPQEYWEIKMAWSEFRNGKWTQKQVSKDATYSNANGKEINVYKFIPQQKDGQLFINIEDGKDNGTNVVTLETFEFNGSKLGKSTKTNLPSSVQNNFGILSFHEKDNRIKSLQINNNNWFLPPVEFSELSLATMVNISFTKLSFHHPDTKELLGLINLGKLPELFSSKFTNNEDAYGKDNENYHELKRPYSLYNWELLFHSVGTIAEKLNESQHYEQAMQWWHYIFNPFAEEGTDEKRFWQFLPFKTDARDELTKIFTSISNNDHETIKKVNEWRDKPFMPHLVARSRSSAYMKWVVMRYIDNLIDWGDSLFRQDTIETINQATQLYILARHILGARPQVIPKQGKTTNKSYVDLLDKWDAFSNAMTEYEVMFPNSVQMVDADLSDTPPEYGSIFGFGTGLYFCIPNNPTLLAYWDTIEDRLFKIRHCLNIEGVFRKLPLFEPPIDPALLVQATAQGLSISSVLGDLNTPMPNYRYNYLMQKALELCGELKSLGNALLSALEKKDNEALSLLRAKHETVMQNLMMEIKKQQSEEAQKNLEALQYNRQSPMHRFEYYKNLSGEQVETPTENNGFTLVPNTLALVDGDSGLKLIENEKEDMDKASAAADWQIAIGITETLASLFHIIPYITVDGKPLGVGAGVQFGGQLIGNAAQAVAKGMQTYSNHLSFQSSSAGKKATFQRAIQERKHQLNMAGFEIKQIDKQVLTQKIRVNISQTEINNQQKSIDHTQEVEDYLKNKYSNEELYTWMTSQIKLVYKQVYNLAFDLAKKAEKVYRFEKGLSNSNFIQYGYWEEGNNGLMAGERLYLALK